MGGPTNSRHLAHQHIYTSPAVAPLEGESQKPSRKAKTDAVGGPTNSRHLAAGSASDRHSQGAASPPPSGSTAGSALSPTPPPGGSDLEACIRRSSITPPCGGVAEAEPPWRRLMRWGANQFPPSALIVITGRRVPPLRSAKHIYTSPAVVSLPLEGESQKPSRQAKADAVGGVWRATSQ